MLDTMVEGVKKRLGAGGASGVGAGGGASANRANDDRVEGE